MPALPPFSTLARAVARGADPAALLVELHRELLTATRGTRSVILQRGGRSGDYAVTSGHGVQEADRVWLRGDAAVALGSRGAGGTPWLQPLDHSSALRERLDGASALIAPLAGPGSTGFLLVSDPQVPASEAIEIAERAAAEFALALELSRLARDAALHHHIQELLLGFSSRVSETLSVAAALGSLCAETNALFGTTRASVWLHNRRAREVVLTASSDPDYGASGVTVWTDSDAHAARGLRVDRSQIAGEGAATTLISPLRGWRRALGTLVFEGEPAGLDDRQFVDAAHELGRQLSVAIENVQLLDVVLQHRRLLEDTFNALLDLVIVVDTDLRVVQMNDAFVERVGRAAADMMEQPLQDFIGPEMAAWIAAPETGRKSADAPAGALPTERTRVFTDQPLDGIFAATVTPLINQSGNPAGRVIVARDITARTRLEAEREALRERLGQSEKLASLGQFVAGIAHEMNNPLQGVLGHLELLIETSDAAKPVRSTLRRIYQEADRAAKIVRNLTMFTGSQRWTRTPLRIERVLGKALASRAVVRRRAHIDLARQVAQDVPVVAGDASLLHQALLNVLINAEHAITASGRPGRIETAIDVTEDGDSVRLTIRDTGDGIPAEILPRIFDPFFTTKEVGQGTGLGLAITFGIIHDHGGLIHASNAAAGGARFTIELPAVRTVGTPVEAERRPKTERV